MPTTLRLIHAEPLATVAKCSVPEKSDAQLVFCAQQGERGAAADLLARSSEHVERLLIRILGFDHELEDAVQDVLVELLAKLPILREPEAYRGWLTSVVVCHARKRIRTRMRHRWLVFCGPSEMPEVSATGVQVHREMLGRVYRHLTKLEPDERIALLLRDIEQMTLPEVADACGCSLATAKRRIARGRQKFESMARQDAQLCDYRRNSS